jgi:ribosome-binding factor A
MTRRRHAGPTPTREYPRTARLNHLLHEIVAEEIERLDDERLGFTTVVAVEVEPDLRHATVHYTTLEDPEVEAALVDVLEEHRPRIQSAIARQARLKRTPELLFRPDPVSRQAERVESILRDIGVGGDGAADHDAVGGDGAVDHDAVGGDGAADHDAVGGDGAADHDADADGDGDADDGSGDAGDRPGRQAD